MALYNRSAFAKPFQEFSKALTGCGSVFTPYNFLDSERSALMTVEAGIKVLMGQLEGNPLLSWKGEDTLFLKMDMKLHLAIHLAQKSSLIQGIFIKMMSVEYVQRKDSDTY